MEVVNNKALLLTVRNPEHITAVIPKSQQLDDNQVLVKWGLDEARVLRNLRVKNVPSPILGQYRWPGMFTPMAHQKTTAAFLTLNQKCFCFNEQGCVDADTEYLSPTGWVPISQYAGGEVAQYHPDTRAISFVVPKAFVKKPCSVMYHFKTKNGIDQQLSPEHRMLVHDVKSASKHVVLSAETVRQQHDAYHRGEHSPPSGPRKLGTDTVAFSGMGIPATFGHPWGPGIPLTEQELRLQVAVIADGHIPQRQGRRYCVVRLKRPHKIARMKTLLEGIPHRHSIDTSKSGAGFHVFSFTPPMRCKEFTSEFYQCSPEQVRTIADEVLHWDGSRRGATRGDGFYSNSKASADFIQLVFVSQGRIARVTTTRRDRRNPEYVVHIRKPGSGILTLRSSGPSVVTVTPQDGNKYCFTVPTSFLVFRRNGCVFASGNTGKSASAIWAADYLMSIGKIRRALIVCPVSIMDSVWKDELFKLAMHRTTSVVYGSADKRRRILAEGAEFCIINYAGLEIVEQEIKAGGFDLVIVDECFVAGTPVLTPRGPKPIETLQAGDTVLTSAGERRIRTTTRRQTRRLVTLELSNGDSITCTPEHPVFTDLGWVTASHTEGRRLLHHTEMPDLWGRVPATNQQSLVVADPQHWCTDDLLEILRTEEAPQVEPRNERVQVPPSTSEEPWAARVPPVAGTTRSNLQGTEGQGAPPPSAGGQRNGHVAGRRTRPAYTGVPLGMELPDSVGAEAARLSYELQSRFRESHSEGGPGSGWGEPYGGIAEGAGPEEGSQTGGVRVVRVSYTECASGTDVFNLDVAGTPNYFVGNGVLVHNCNAYKNPASKRWKCLNRIVTPDMWLWMMTGTPASQSPTDAYGLAKLVNPTAVPRFAGAFRDMVMSRITQFRWIPKTTAHKIVHQVLQPATRVTKDECLDLPDMVYTSRDVPLTKQQQHYYKLLKDRMVMVAAGEEVSAANAAVHIGKLLQVSAGAAYSTDGNTVEFDVTSRFNVLMEVIEESSQKVLVFVPFRHSIQILQEKLTAAGVPTEMIFGDIPVPKRTEIFHAFQTTPHPKVLLIQPHTVAHGVTLTAANTVVWWSPIPSCETYEQANARVHRKGQKHPCTVVHLQGSPVERHIYTMLRQRLNVHEKMIDLYRGAIA